MPRHMYTCINGVFFLRETVFLVCLTFHIYLLPERSCKHTNKIYRSRFIIIIIIITDFYGWLRLLTWGRLIDPSLHTSFTKTTTPCKTMLMMVKKHSGRVHTRFPTVSHCIPCSGVGVGWVPTLF